MNFIGKADYFLHNWHHCAVRCWSKFPINPLSVNRFITFSGDNILNFIAKQNDISFARFEITDGSYLNQ